jgi:putative toxin-antitoxin system antitoxin component (TIGR02293 family)
MQQSMVSDVFTPYNVINKNNIFDIIESVRSGFNYDRFSILTQNCPFTSAEWCLFLHISDRTLQRYKIDGRSFDTLQAEKILQITMLYKNGLSLFGSKENFDAWLVAKNLAFGNNTPKSLLDSVFGINLINDELIRIEHGVFA